MKLISLFTLTLLLALATCAAAQPATNSCAHLTGTPAGWMHMISPKGEHWDVAPEDQDAAIRHGYVMV